MVESLQALSSVPAAAGLKFFCQCASHWQFRLIIPGTDTCWSSLHDFGRNYKPPIPKWGKQEVQTDDSSSLTSSLWLLISERTLKTCVPHSHSHPDWLKTMLSGIMQIPETVTPKCGVYYEYIWIYPISSLSDPVLCQMKSLIPSFLCLCDDKQFGEKACTLFAHLTIMVLLATF